ncbi:Relaxin receptor 2, partial [Trichoplax sp. H2]
IRRGEAHSYLNSGFSVILRFTILPYVVVFALPINSAINPFLYTFTSSNFTDRLPGWCKMDRSKWPLFGSLSSLNQSSKSNSSLTISSPSERIQSSASIDSKS